VNGLIVNDEIMYKDFEWSSVAITSYGEGLYYTPNASKLDASMPGYTIIGVTFKNWTGAASGGLPQFYVADDSGKISACSAISQTITKLWVRVIYKRN